MPRRRELDLRQPRRQQGLGLYVKQAWHRRRVCDDVKQYSTPRYPALVPPLRLTSTSTSPSTSAHVHQRSLVHGLRKGWAGGRKRIAGFSHPHACSCSVLSSRIHVTHASAASAHPTCRVRCSGGRHLERLARTRLLQWDDASPHPHPRSPGRHRRRDPDQAALPDLPSVAAVGVAHRQTASGHGWHHRGMVRLARRSHPARVTLRQ